MATDEIRGIRFQHPMGPGAMVEVVRLDELRARELDHSLYAVQRRNFHVFQLVTAGRGRHHFEFDSVRLRRGDVFHIRPGQVDWFDEASDHQALLLVFVPEAIPTPRAVRLRLTNPLRPSPEDFARLEQLAVLIEQFHCSLVLQESVLLLLQSFLSAVDSLHADATSSSPSASSHRLCERFEELLVEHHFEHRVVEWYADRLGVSTKSLARACSAVVGSSPKQHIDRAVTLQAKRILVHTPSSVEDLATQLGFSESTNFVKFFRRVEGCTPQSFRDRFRRQHR